LPLCPFPVPLPLETALSKELPCRILAVTGDFVTPVQEKGLRLRIVRSELIIRSDRRMLAQMIRKGTPMPTPALSR